MQKVRRRQKTTFGIIKYMNEKLRDEIFIRTNEVRYSEDTNETAHWLVNEYAKLLTDEQGREYLGSIIKKIELNKEIER